MHPAWLVEDVRRLLMGAVVGDPPSSTNQTRQDLARLARVCHLFTELATDHLWRDLPDVTPILRLMPSLQFNDSGTDLVSFELVLTLWSMVNLEMKLHIDGSFPCAADWSAISRYAPKVQALILPDEPFSDLVNERRVFEAFDPTQNQGHGLVLPHLTKLRLYPGEAILAQIAAFVHPGLFDLSLFFLLRPDEKNAVLHSLSFATSIRRLDLFHPQNQPLLRLRGDAARMEHLLEALQHLESISRHIPADLTTLHILSARQALRCMSVVLAIRVDGLGLGADAFPVLEDLELFGDTDTCRMLLFHISSPILNRLKLGLDGNNGHALLTCCSVIQQKFAPCLRKLHIRLVPSLHDDPFEDLRPLLACHRLMELELECFGLWILADSDLKTMADSWLSLTSLTLSDIGNASRPLEPYGASMLGLLWLAHLPRLQTLRLPISCFDIPDTIATVPTASQVRELTLEITMPITSPDPFGTFISRHFPLLPWGGLEIISKRGDCNVYRLQLLRAFQQCYLEVVYEDLDQLFSS